MEDHMAYRVQVPAGMTLAEARVILRGWLRAGIRAVASDGQTVPLADVILSRPLARGGPAIGRTGRGTTKGALYLAREARS